MMTWNELQIEVTAWVRHNFGDQNNSACQATLGLVEEVAEFMAAREAGDHGQMEDALGDQAIYVLNLCTKVGLDFEFHVAGANNGATDYADREVLGALGLASHAVLKFEQGIRGMDLAARASRMAVALGTWYRWASWQCLEHNIDPMQMVTIKVWSEVRRRDWTKNRANAHEVVRDDLSAGK